MTRKHYVAIASLFKTKIDRYNSIRKGSDMADATAHLAYDMADYFEKENPSFNRGKFLSACGITKG